MSIGCSTHTTANLRGNDNAITIFPLAHPAPDDHLGFATNVTRNPGRVNICRIDKITAAREVSVQHRKRGLLVSSPAKNIATQAKCCYFQVRPVKLTYQHKKSLLFIHQCAVLWKAAASRIPTVLHSLLLEGISSLKGLADRLSGHNPAEAPHPLSYEYKEEAL